MIRYLVIWLMFAQTATAQSVIATRIIPAQTILAPSDLAVVPQNYAGAIKDPALVLGLETRVALFAGRPVRSADIGAPAIIERNQIIPLHYQSGLLSITTEGRALARAGVGDVIRVMNLGSRATVTGIITEDGAAYVR